MIDMTDTIIPKSDQLNADDLIGGSLTIHVTKVSRASSPEQPIAINFEGDNGKPYKPCKSMRRVLVRCWGPDGSAYVGRGLTLYRDDRVKFGGAEVGGIRISHMTHIDGPIQMALTETKAKRVPFRVLPLAAPQTRQEPPPTLDQAKTLAQMLEALRAALTPDAAPTRADVDAVIGHARVGKALATDGAHVGIMRELIKAARDRTAEPPPPAEDDDDWPGPKVGGPA